MKRAFRIVVALCGVCCAFVAAGGGAAGGRDGVPSPSANNTGGGAAGGGGTPPLPSEAEEEEGYELDRWQVGVAATMTLPQGGSRLRRLGGAAGRFGYYLSDFWAVEGEAAWVEDAAGLAADVLWHWWGYERFDPFFTVGARGWIGACGQVGPKAGVGAFYHLTDAWSLRFDADATLGLDTRRSVDYTLSAGVQRSF